MLTGVGMGLLEKASTSTQIITLKTNKRFWKALEQERMVL